MFTDWGFFSSDDSPDEIKSLPYYDDLSDLQREELRKYMNNDGEYTDSQYKQQTYQLSKQDQHEHAFARGVVELTTWAEKTKWDTLDAVGLGTNDRLEYKKFMETISKRVKVVSVVVAVGLAYVVLRKGDGK